MDPIIQDLLEGGGKTVLATTLTLCLTKLLRGRKKEAVAPREKKRITLVAEKMIQAASMEDIRQFSSVQHIGELPGQRKKEAPRRMSREKPPSMPASQGHSAEARGSKTAVTRSVEAALSDNQP